MTAPSTPTTGPDFVAHHVLPDGTTILVRHLRPEDAPQFRAAFDRLSPASRFRRFFGAVTTLSDEMLEYLTNVDGQDHVAIAAAIVSPDLKTEQGIGVARFIRVPGEPDVAEAAVTVVDEMQNRGIGRILLTTLADAARERGVKRFRAEVLASNLPIRRMLEEAHAILVREDGGTITLDVPLDAQLGAADAAPESEPPTPKHDGALAHFLRVAASSMAGIVRALPMPPRR